MNHALSDIILVMKEKYGKDISAYHEAFLKKMLEKRLAAKGLEKVSSYYDVLASDSNEAEEFFKSLNIIFSQFFRDSVTFALLEQYILPELVRKKQNGEEVRVWSAGCAYGQEAYSIAMLLDELIAAENKNLRLMIFATDNSYEALESAKAGVYEANDVQNVKTRLLQKYFIESTKTYTVVPQLKRNVNFSYYDMADQLSAHPSESIYGGFDIVFCCNLLFYYSHDLQGFMINKLKKSLSSAGFMITGSVEKTIVEKTGGMRTFIAPAPVFQNI